MSRRSKRRRFFGSATKSKAVKLGCLYNWPTTQGTGDNSIIPLAMANAGWVIPTHFNVMKAYLGGDSVAGGKLKEAGFTYWESPNAGATNNYNFSCRGAGHREISGLYSSLKTGTKLWTLYDDGTVGATFEMTNYTESAGYNLTNKKYGCSIRLVRPIQLGEQTIPDGQPVGTYTGNNGLVYPTTRIGDEVWMACNLAETKFRNMSDIPLVTDNSAWSALTTSAMCYYNNDINNVFE